MDTRSEQAEDVSVPIDGARYPDGARDSPVIPQQIGALLEERPILPRPVIEEPTPSHLEPSLAVNVPQTASLTWQS